MPVSNFDLLWNEQQRALAAEDGWLLALTVDSGKPVTTAYFEIFQYGPKFGTRTDAVRHVIGRAQESSKLHINALAARQASRVPWGKR